MLFFILLLYRRYIIHVTSSLTWQLVITVDEIDRSKTGRMADTSQLESWWLMLIVGQNNKLVLVTFLLFAIFNAGIKKYDSVNFLGLEKSIYAYNSLAIDSSMYGDCLPSRGFKASGYFKHNI